MNRSEGIIGLLAKRQISNVLYVSLDTRMQIPGLADIGTDASNIPLIDAWTTEIDSLIGLLGEPIPPVDFFGHALLLAYMVPRLPGSETLAGLESAPQARQGHAVVRLARRITRVLSSNEFTRCGLSHPPLIYLKACLEPFATLAVLGAGCGYADGGTWLEIIRTVGAVGPAFSCGRLFQFGSSREQQPRAVSPHRLSVDRPRIAQP